MMPEKAHEPEKRRHPSSGGMIDNRVLDGRVRRIAAGAQPERSVPVGSPAWVARAPAGRAGNETGRACRRGCRSMRRLAARRVGE